MDCLIALDPDTARGYMGDGCGRLLAESELRDPAQAAIEEQLADTLPVTFLANASQWSSVSSGRRIKDRRP